VGVRGCRSNGGNHRRERDDIRRTTTTVSGRSSQRRSPDEERDRGSSCTSPPVIPRRAWPSQTPNARATLPWTLFSAFSETCAMSEKSTGYGRSSIRWARVHHPWPTSSRSPKICNFVCGRIWKTASSQTGHARQDNYRLHYQMRQPGRSMRHWAETCRLSQRSKTTSPSFAMKHLRPISPCIRHLPKHRHTSRHHILPPAYHTSVPMRQMRLTEYLATR
jgi:hypothetical protein